MSGLNENAQGRIAGAGPVAVIDIGSNSVRLVAYERLARSPTPLFNEKVLAGLGAGVAATGALSAGSVGKAQAALRRFTALAAQMRIVDLHVWDIGPGYRAAILVVDTDHPLTPQELKERLPEELGIAHATVEIHDRRGRPESAGSEETL